MSFLIKYCRTNNVDQNQPKDIASGIRKFTKTFMKKQPKINTIMTGILPREKTYSFRQTKIDRKNQILKIKCKNLRPTNVMDQDDNWVKSDMTLNENFYHKDFLHLVETGNKDFYKSTSLF